MRFFPAFALALLPAPLMAEVPRVVTDIHPVHALVSLVMGDLGRPDLLLDKGANNHSFTLRPSQAAGLQDADLVVWVGPELTPWLDRALEGAGAKAGRLGLLALPATLRRDYGAEDGIGGHDHSAAAHDGKDHDDDHGHDQGHDRDADHDHDHDHDHEDDHDHDHDGHAHAGLDPHAWLDPANAQVWLDAIAAALAARDAANAATYTANAAAARDRIAALDHALAAELAPIRDKPFVVFHDAYGYFAGHYGLTIAGSVALGDAAAPGAAHAQETRATLASGRILCAFPEAQHDPRLLTTLLDGTPVRLGAPLDPSGSSLEPGPRLYETLLRGMADTLRGCLN